MRLTLKILVDNQRRLLMQLYRNLQLADDKKENGSQGERIMGRELVKNDTDSSVKITRDNLHQCSITRHPETVKEEPSRP